MLLNQQEKNIGSFSIVFLFLFLCFAVTYFHGFDWDVHCWAVWSAHIFHHGLPQAYDAPYNTYMPVYQYILYFFAELQDSEEAIHRNINYIRAITLLFEFAGLWYIYKWVDKKISYHLVVLFAMLNLAYSYNTVIWGQVDGISSALAFIAMYYGTNRKPLLSALFMMLAVNMKLQVIIFIPVWGLLYLNNVAREKSWKAFFLPPLLMIAVQVLLLVPFMFYEKGLQQVYNAVFTSVGTFPKVSVFAFNIWYWICPTNPVETLDSEILLLGMSYKSVGLLLFFSFSLLAMLPMIINISKSLFRKDAVLWPSREQVWLVCSLIAVFFFYFNTQMHERYSHPAFIFITAYAFYSRHWLPYILFSAAYLLNLDKILRAFRMSNYDVFIYNERFIAVLYGATIILLAIRLIRQKPNLLPSNG